MVFVPPQYARTEQAPVNAGLLMFPGIVVGHGRYLSNLYLTINAIDDRKCPKDASVWVELSAAGRAGDARAVLA